MLRWLRRRKPDDELMAALESEPEPTDEELEMEVLDAMNEAEEER